MGPMGVHSTFISNPCIHSVLHVVYTIHWMVDSITRFGGHLWVCINSTLRLPHLHLCPYLDSSVDVSPPRSEVQSRHWKSHAIPPPREPHSHIDHIILSHHDHASYWADCMFQICAGSKLADRPRRSMRRDRRTSAYLVNYALRYSNGADFPRPEVALLRVSESGYNPCTCSNPGSNLGGVLCC
ncbi:uncharacterized protein MYCFIDRAFT_173126 [Pseudocercospora fijiensis CIRAD86]|uniref:Uncharacterized protein n=1 Tax=Pseudocercospora fijiensis (strain CIRAD86) TaxID=383855 RepID=M3AHK5_PSEFD|nr:uncharacterized protein MYCFIDRAFT_173126 [Pseudocercospora fijiensis CIRAD86]EME84076.1 hypothetical protein MYCFIDRAFT_173126 [Pseudocercospora fijiensis CIRAD86]